MNRRAFIAMMFGAAGLAAVGENTSVRPIDKTSGYELFSPESNAFWRGWNHGISWLQKRQRDEDAIVIKWTGKRGE